MALLAPEAFAGADGGSRMGGMNMDWISVKDRMPEKNKSVIGWYKDNPFSNFCVEIVLWNGKGWVCTYGKHYVTAVSHWMPLPEPPKEETE